MNKQAEVAVFDGAVVRMFARGWGVPAGRRDGHDTVVEQLLFEAGRSIVSMDLLAGFWRDEAAEMDWLEDFLCDPATDEMMAVLLAPPADEEEEEEEMLYSKSMLVTTGMEMSDYS